MVKGFFPTDHKLVCMGNKCDKLLYLGQRDIRSKMSPILVWFQTEGCYLFRKFEIFGNHEPNIFCYGFPSKSS